MNHFDLAYWAGLFDGEGTVTTDKRKKSTAAHGYLLFSLATVSNNERRVLEELKAEFGGSLSRHLDKRVSNPNQRLVNWQWVIVSNQLTKFLTDLPIPANQEETSRISNPALTTEKFDSINLWHFHKIPEIDWQVRENLRARIRELNSRFNGRNDSSMAL